MLARVAFTTLVYEKTFTGATFLRVISEANPVRFSPAIRLVFRRLRLACTIKPFHCIFYGEVAEKFIRFNLCKLCLLTPPLP